MPGRSHIFEEGGYYHIYNKTIDDKKPFLTARNCQIFKHMMWFYRARKLDVKHSRFMELPLNIQTMYFPIINNIENRDVDILAYCIMPNHYHMLIQEKKKGGISAYMSKLQNSFTRYYNIKLQRKGQLFLSRFKSKPITTEELVKHVARYINLNPLSSRLIRNIDELGKYPYTSLSDLNVSIDVRSTLITNVEKLLGFFGGEKDRYLKFLADNADYQKSLETIKKLEKSLIK